AAEPAAVAETAGSPAVSTPEAAEAAPGGTAESDTTAAEDRTAEETPGKKPRKRGWWALRR
ncbi:MAG: hypothetical protein ACQEUZ_07045, partial [Pseudomonadota bacterium]